jgi:signal transduction histidine kinase
MRNEFISTITHDLGNPLTTLKGYAQMLRWRVSPNTPDRDSIAKRATPAELADRIERAVQQIQVAIDELLDLASLQSGQRLQLRRELVDLVSLAHQVVEQAQHATDQHHIRLQSCVVTLMGKWDRPRLERAISNLVSNAIKYSPEGGAIAVCLAREGEGADSWAVLSVSDSGLGIPAADLPHIFEQYRRGANVANTIRGRGIGLTSVRQVVEAHGGTLAVVSQEGVGSTFTIRLPCLPSDANQTPGS